MLRIRKAKRQMGMSGKNAQILRYPSVWVFERPQEADARNRELSAPPSPVCSGGSLCSILQLHKMTVVGSLYIQRLSLPAGMSIVYLHHLSLSSVPSTVSTSLLSFFLTLPLLCVSRSRCMLCHPQWRLCQTTSRLPGCTVPASLAPCCQSWHLLRSSFCGICPSFLL